MMEDKGYDRMTATLIAACGGSLENVDVEAAVQGLLDALTTIAIQKSTGDPNAFMVGVINTLKKVVDTGLLDHLQESTQQPIPLQQTKP